MTIKKRPTTSRDAEIEAFGDAAETTPPPSSAAVKKAKSATQQKAVLLRLTVEQHALLAEVAESDRRSMNAMVLQILIPELERRRNQAKP